MWVAKNNVKNARPCLFYHKPSRLNDRQWYGFGSDYGFPLYDMPEFDKITWEDEPIEVEIKIKNNG